MLTSPGVQILEPDVGTALARDANDRLAEAIRNHPEKLFQTNAERLFRL